MTNATAAAGDPFVSVFGEQRHFACRDTSEGIWGVRVDGGTPAPEPDAPSDVVDVHYGLAIER
jgi:hypothetical protein